MRIPTYVVRGVRYRRVQSNYSKYHRITASCPRVHVTVYDSLNGYYYRFCDEAIEPQGAPVGKETPVTCKLCINSGGA